MQNDALSPFAPLPTILLIDDHEDLRSMWALLLELHGFQVTTARGGAEGVKIATEITPSIIVTDLMMPEMDGVAVCRAIRSNELLTRTPIIMWTAMSSAETHGLADVLLQKPVTVEVMIAHIKALCRVS